MSKKAKGVALGGFLPVSEDAKARLKRETLMQDYQDLQKEACGMRKKLDAAKQRRGELLAEVRFLRKRQRYLLKIKSMERSKEQLSNRGKNKNDLTTKGHVTTKGRKSHKNEAAQFKLPPLPVLKPRVYDIIPPKNISSGLDLNPNLALQSGRDASLHNPTDANYRKRISSDSDAAVRNIKPTFYLKDAENFQGGNGMGSKIPALDLNLDNSVVRNEAVLPSRIRTFDLNVASMEEEELQVGDEPRIFEESKKNLIRAGYDEQAGDINISVCRNSGEGPSRIGKRKITWQDPVALRV